MSRQGTLLALTGHFDQALERCDAGLALGKQVGETDRVRVWRDQIWSLELLRGDTGAAHLAARCGGAELGERARAALTPLADQWAVVSGGVILGPMAYVFRFDGQVWTLGYAGRTAHAPDAKGLRDLHTLLGRPGAEVPAAELYNPTGDQAVHRTQRLGADPTLDDQARAAYKNRLLRIDEDIQEALDRGDDRRAAALDQEREALIAELRGATGLGGRARQLGDAGERARQAVTARIRDSPRRLRPLHPELAEHLAASVSTGAQCRYQPAPTRWSR